MNSHNFSEFKKEKKSEKEQSWKKCQSEKKKTFFFPNVNADIWIWNRFLNFYFLNIFEHCLVFVHRIHKWSFVNHQFRNLDLFCSLTGRTWSSKQSSRTQRRGWEPGFAGKNHKLNVGAGKSVACRWPGGTADSRGERANGFCLINVC